MGRHNLHFTDGEAARNWADNYGGKLHNNMHTRGERGSETNFTVSEEYEDDGCECDREDHPITKELPEGTIVYHYMYGEGRVYYDDGAERRNGYFRVDFKNSIERCYNASNEHNTIKFPLLSFTPYTLEEGGFSRDLKDRKVFGNIHQERKE